LLFFTSSPILLQIAVCREEIKTNGVTFFASWARRRDAAAIRSQQTKQNFRNLVVPAVVPIPPHLSPHFASPSVQPQLPFPAFTSAAESKPLAPMAVDSTAITVAANALLNPSPVPMNKSLPLAAPTAASASGKSTSIISQQHLQRSFAYVAGNLTVQQAYELMWQKMNLSQKQACALMTPQTRLHWVMLWMDKIAQSQQNR